MVPSFILATTIVVTVGRKSVRRQVAQKILEKYGRNGKGQFQSATNEDDEDCVAADLNCWNVTKRISTL